MQIKAKANLTLTVPNPKKDESTDKIMLLAEQHINTEKAYFIVPETKTKVGIRIHVQEGKQVK